jgi:hypothetical protein
VSGYVLAWIYAREWTLTKLCRIHADATGYVVDVEACWACLAEYLDCVGGFEEAETSWEVVLRGEIVSDGVRGG